MKPIRQILVEVSLADSALRYASDVEHHATMHYHHGRKAQELDRGADESSPSEHFHRKAARLHKEVADAMDKLAKHYHGRIHV